MKFLLNKLLSQTVGQKAVLAATFSALSSIFLIYSVSITRSLVIIGTAWISVFSFFCLLSTIISLLNNNFSNKRYTYGFVRATVLAIFSTTVLTQLSSIFLIKEAVERIVEIGHYHNTNIATNHYFYASAIVNALSLFVASYVINNQPLNYVLMAAQSSIIQEHATDISRALCHVIPGLSRVLLPRINSLTLLAIISALCCVFTDYFINDFWWFDSVAALVLSGAVFATMMPLSTYTGRILLQTTQPHVHNQIDRCISEASTVEGVLELKNGHFWQLDFNTIAGTIDVRIRRDANEQIVLGLVNEKLSIIVSNLTIQVLKDITTTWNNETTMISSNSFPTNYDNNLPYNQFNHSLNQYHNVKSNNSYNHSYNNHNH